jgi:hypothetical protein
MRTSTDVCNETASIALIAFTTLLQCQAQAIHVCITLRYTQMSSGIKTATVKDRCNHVYHRTHACTVNTRFLRLAPSNRLCRRAMNHILLSLPSVQVYNT